MRAAQAFLSNSNDAWTSSPGTSEQGMKVRIKRHYDEVVLGSELENRFVSSRRPTEIRHMLRRNPSFG